MKKIIDHDKITLFFDFKNLCRIILQNILNETKLNKGFILFHNQKNNTDSIIDYYGLSSKLFQDFYIKKYLDAKQILEPIGIKQKNNPIFEYLKKTLTDKLEQIFIIPIDLQNNRRFGYLILLQTLSSNIELNDILPIINNHLLILKSNITLEIVEKLDDFNIFDPTTLLFNQDFLYENLYRHIIEAERLNTKFSIALIEINNLNNLAKNNAELSANLLKILTDFLKKHLRKIDVLAMLYNTIISIIFPDMDYEQTFNKLEELKLKLIKFKLENNQKNLLSEIEIIYGIADYPQSGKTCEALIRSAIKKMANA
ncbi:MAG TPA: diguanylate cyclase [bacterium]|nr:diguanylate cyclase [bacterium]